MRWIVPIAVAVALVALALFGTMAHAQQLANALEAYSYIIRLSELGVNTTGMINELNNAIEMGELGYTSNATAIINNLITEARAELPIAQQHYWLFIAIDAVVAAVAVTLASILYVKRRELIGSMWLRFRGEDRVRNGGSGRPRSMLFNAEVASVVLAIIIILTVFLVAQLIVSGRTQPFSAIALLGPSGKIGGYPSTVIVGQPINLYIYVYNHMNAPTWFVVRLYITNNTALQPPLNITPIATYQRVLGENDSWLIPITFTLNSTGTYRLIGELWMYSPNNLTLTYTGNYVQLWVNATRVMPSG
jgi:hypothetical protein